VCFFKSFELQAMNRSNHLNLQFSKEDEVNRLAERVVDLSLPKSEWTHAAHFALALWLLRHKPQGYAEAQIPRIIRAYNEATGVANTDRSGYHETITLASLQAAQTFLEDQPPTRPVHEIVGSLMQTRLGHSGWLQLFWSKETLFSTHARRTWTDPDLRPLSKQLYAAAADAPINAG
jgi:hypothetical protein